MRLNLRKSTALLLTVLLLISMLPTGTLAEFTEEIPLANDQTELIVTDRFNSVMLTGNAPENLFFDSGYFDDPVYQVNSTGKYVGVAHSNQSDYGNSYLVTSSDKKDWQVVTNIESGITLGDDCALPASITSGAWS